jgi:hypothetical protein
MEMDNINSEKGMPFGASPSQSIIHPADSVLQIIEAKKILDGGDQAGAEMVLSKMLKSQGISELHVNETLVLIEKGDFKFDFRDKWLLKVLVSQYLINDLNSRVFELAQQQNTEILSTAKKGQVFVLDSFKQDVEKRLLPILEQSAKVHGEIKSNLSALEVLMGQLTADGPVANQFSIVLLEKMAAGVEQKVKQVQGSLDETLSKQSLLIENINNEIEKVQLLDPDALTQKFTGQVSDILNQSTAEKIQKFNQMGNAAVSTVQKSCEQAVAEIDVVKYSMLKVAAEAQNAIAEKTKGDLVKYAFWILGLGVVVNLITVAVFFKLIWPHIQ